MEYGKFWSRGYFYRSVGSTTNEAVEFYIKVSQNEELREKYYRKAYDEDGPSGEDPFLEHQMGNLDLETISDNQMTLMEFRNR
ncbi:MAG: hypothetical protein R6U17_01635 [Thermoplasmata archaeon]